MELECSTAIRDWGVERKMIFQPSMDVTYNSRLATGIVNMYIQQPLCGEGLGTRPFHFVGKDGCTASTFSVFFFQNTT